MTCQNGKETQGLAKKTSNKTIKSTYLPPSYKPYQEILSFYSSGEISLFESENYKFYVPILMRYEARYKSKE